MKEVLHAIDEAMSLLPERMDSKEARVMLVAIGLQESRLIHRRQLVGNPPRPTGPATGLWQFERGGGVVGDASSLPVTSESQTMSLSEWMTYVRSRANHTGTQQASTISDFGEAVTTRMSESVGSTTLEIEYDADQEVIFLDNPQGKAREVQSIGGVLQVTSEGGVVVPLIEDVTEVLLPVGEFFTTKVLSIVFVQDSTTPYTVSGWPSDVEWVGGAAPVINPELDSQTLITLINVDNRGWMGSSSESFDVAGSAAQALADAKDYTDQALQSPIPVAVEEEANIPNNCLFVDSVDDVLKFKDAQGIVHVVSLVP